MLLLAQPRFSQPGHFAHFTLLNARALQLATPLQALVYVHSDNAGRAAVLTQLSQLVPTEVVRGADFGWRKSTWLVYRRLVEMVSKNPAIQSVFFLDPSLMTLAAALVFQPLPRACPVVATELFGPELYLADSFVNVRLKRLLLAMASRYRRLRIAPFTSELTTSWRRSGLLPPEACLDLPTLQMADAVPPTFKEPLASRDGLTFALIGSLRRQKNLDRIVPLFRDGNVSGQLMLAGEVLAGEGADHLAGLVAKAGGCIDFRPYFLPESELHHLVSLAHYNLLLYIDFDERMESAMLFTSTRLGSPVIGTQAGWLGRMIREYNLGYAINPHDTEQIQACLTTCALPGSAEYRRFETGIRHLLAEYRREAVVPRFLAKLGIAA